MRLSELLAAAGFDAPARDAEIVGVSDDSRRVRHGELFVARPGPTEDGRRYVRDAIARGAAAVVAQTPIDYSPVPHVVVADASSSAGKLAHAFHGDPSRSLKLLGVTGTNGKTTVAYLLRHVLARAGLRCGLIGTVEIDDGSSAVESDVTTPGAVELAGLLARMRDHGCDACAMEVSSHALDQSRVAAMTFAGAGFTNLSGDHLDYHKTMEAYADAKAKLFDSLAGSAAAVVNDDDAYGERMARDCHGRIARYTIQDGVPSSDARGFPTRRTGPGDFRATDVVVDAAGTRFTLRRGGESWPVEMRLVGRHNVQNALVAIGLAVEACGVDVAQAVEAMRDAAGAPGRLQRVAGRRRADVSVLVDYAHTDDALENVLTALRPLTRGKLRVVFGCGGDRDRTKRPRMAAVAGRLADAVYVTSDNPRSEGPENIIREILAGLSADLNGPVFVDVDRRAAIRRAIEDAAADDVVLIAGKGHEKYQIVAGERQHFDDVEEAERALG